MDPKDKHDGKGMNAGLNDLTLATVKTILAELGQDELHTIAARDLGVPMAGDWEKDRVCRYCHRRMSGVVAQLPVHYRWCPLGVINQAVRAATTESESEYDGDPDVPIEWVQAFLDELELDELNCAGEREIGFGCRYCETTVVPSMDGTTAVGAHKDWCPMGFIIRAVAKALGLKIADAQEEFGQTHVSKPTEVITDTQPLTTHSRKPGRATGENQKKVMEYLQYAQRTHTTKEIAAYVGISSDIARGCLQRLLTKDLVLKVTETGEPVRWRAA